MARPKASETEGKLFARRLREVMEKRGENASTLAAKIKNEQNFTLQRQSISQYMVGQSNPDTERLTAICKALDVSADYLLGLTDQKTQNITLRRVCEVTGFSEASVKALAFANNIDVCKVSMKDGKQHLNYDLDFDFPLVELDDFEVVDDLISRGELGIFSSLQEIKGITDRIAYFREDWTKDNPALSRSDVYRLYQDFRVALFDLTEETTACADSLYNYRDALRQVKEWMREAEERCKEEEAHENGSEE